MGPAFKTYLNSFKLKEKFWKTFLLDAFFLGFIFLLFTLFSRYLDSRAVFLTQSLPTDFLVNASPEELLPYLAQIKSFLLFAVIAIAILLIISVLAYSFSRALIWNYLAKRKFIFKKFWRWNILNLALIVPLLLLGISFLILKLLAVYLINFLLTINISFYQTHQEIMQTIEKFLNDGVSFLILIFVLIFLFLTYAGFVQRRQVWASIGEAFSSFKKYRQKLGPMFLFAFLTAVLLSLISILVKQELHLQFFPWTVITSIITLLFLAWLRLYFLKTIHGYS